MILKLWEGVSLEQYNNWFPLTGKINNIPTKYKSDNPAQNWYQDVNEWFTTFALRAQNDINAYLNFIFNKFPFETLKNKDIKQALVDMVFIRIEHDCFNRVPIEFNTNATNTLTSGSTFDANADVILGLRNLLPQRVQSLVKFTRLKPYFRTLSSKGLNPNDIDLETFYTKFEVDALIEKEQIARMQGDQANHDLTLAKQIKLYDDVITPQQESYRGPVTNLIVRGYVATDYDDKTETAIIDFPKEIGTLPPDALQPNPVEGDVTHAATADFSAKQQKRINTNENNITELTNNKQNKLTTGHGISITDDSVISVSSYLVTPQDFMNNPQWEEQKSMILTRNKYYQIFWSPNMASGQGLKGVFFFYGAVPTAHNVAIDSAGYYSNSTNEIKAHLSVQPENDELILSYFDGSAWIVTNLDGNPLGTRIYKPK